MFKCISKILLTLCVTVILQKNPTFSLRDHTANVKMLMFILQKEMLQKRGNVPQFTVCESIHTEKYNTFFPVSVGAGEVFKSSWFAYKSMEFIADKNTPRQSLSTVSNNT